jgi:hypothetical protein
MIRQRSKGLRAQIPRYSTITISEADAVKIGKKVIDQGSWLLHPMGQA